MRLLGRTAAKTDDHQEPLQVQDMNTMPHSDEAPPVEIPEEMRRIVRDKLVTRIDDKRLLENDPEDSQRRVEALIAEIAEEGALRINRVEQRYLAEQLIEDLVGFGPITKLMADPGVSDIMVNAPDRIYVERNGRIGLSRVRFRDDDHIKSVAQKMARFTGKRVDESTPLMDARLPDGSRVNIVFPPVSIASPLISIRRVNREGIDFERMVDLGSLDGRMRDFFQLAARGRLNIVVSGGTGSGKTTFLNALSHHIDESERIITIEDAAELQFRQPHVVRMETRPALAEGTSPIEQRELLKNSLRMRPDRVLLGECRGSEAFDMLQAMNTGHDGSLTTLHANSPREAMSRLENMTLMAGYDLPIPVIRSMIATAVDLIVQVERMKDGTRRVTSVTEVMGMEGDLITAQDIFTFEVEGVINHRIHGDFVWHNIKPRFGDKLVRYGFAGEFSRLFRDNPN